MADQENNRNAAEHWHCDSKLVNRTDIRTVLSFMENRFDDSLGSISNTLTCLDSGGNTFFKAYVQDHSKFTDLVTSKLADTAIEGVNMYIFDHEAREKVLQQIIKNKAMIKDFDK